MRTKFILLLMMYFNLLPFGGIEGGFAQKNLAFRSNLSMMGSGCWGYADTSGNEYALVGNGPGLSIVDITDPDTPVFLFKIPGYCWIWTEVKTNGPFAYFTSDGCSDTLNGLVIVDLRYLPDSVNYKIWHGEGAIAGQLDNCHTIQISDGFAYLNGCNAGGIVIVDLSDPWNPLYAGTYSTYVHDCFVRNDTAWTAEIYEGRFGVVNVTVKSNPVFIGSQMTPLAFTHNTALSDDGKYLFTTDELKGAWIASYDVTDLSNITLLDRYRPSDVISEDEEDHNTYYLNGFLINGDYGNRVTIVDAARPANLIETGRYEIDPDTCKFWTCLTWDVHPFLPSGNIIASDMNYGMYVLTPTYVRACYLEGMVTDSITGNPLFNVKVELLAANVLDSTALNGEYRTGYADGGTYSVRFSKPGYVTKTITGVVLNNGILTTLNVQLWDGTSTVNVSYLGDYKLWIYPNPFTMAFNFIIPDHIKNLTDVNLIVYDLLGNEMVNRTAAEKIMSIRMDGVAPGIFYYKVFLKGEFVQAGKLYRSER